MEKLIENKASIYEESIRVKSVYSKEDEMRDPENKKEGLEYTFIPHVSNEAEAFERLKFLTGQQLSELYQKHFFRKYPKITNEIIQEEIDVIEAFISKAKKHSIRDSFDPVKIRLGKVEDEYHEYLRLTNHYYQNNYCEYRMNRLACKVFGQYILFYQWLLQLKTKFLQGNEGKSESRTENLIDEKFQKLDKEKSWRYAFRSETDYKSFKNILVRYFEKTVYKLPEEPIELKKRCKTRLAYVLGGIHRELGFRDTLKGAPDFLEIVRVLDQFKALTDVQLIKDLQRFGDD
jgi:hypothetical protein